MIMLISFTLGPYTLTPAGRPSGGWMRWVHELMTSMPQYQVQAPSILRTCTSVGAVLA